MRRYRKDKLYADSIKQVWSEIFGKLAVDLKFGMYRNKVLYLEVLNPIWSTELTHYKADIMAKIDKAVGKKGLVTDIKVRTVPPVMTRETDSKTGYGDIPFVDKIKAENEKRKRDGAVLCTQCGATYTTDSVCTFCRLENSGKLAKDYPQGGDHGQFN